MERKPLKLETAFRQTMEAWAYKLNMGARIEMIPVTDWNTVQFVLWSVDDSSNRRIEDVREYAVRLPWVEFKEG